MLGMRASAGATVLNCLCFAWRGQTKYYFVWGWHLNCFDMPSRHHVLTHPGFFSRMKHFVFQCHVCRLLIFFHYSGRRRGAPICPDRTRSAFRRDWWSCSTYSRCLGRKLCTLFSTVGATASYHRTWFGTRTCVQFLLFHFFHRIKTTYRSSVRPRT